MENPTKQQAIHALTQLGVNSPEATQIIERLPHSFKTVIAICTRTVDNWNSVLHLQKVVNYCANLILQDNG